MRRLFRQLLVRLGHESVEADVKHLVRSQGLFRWHLGRQLHWERLERGWFEVGVGLARSGSFWYTRLGAVERIEGDVGWRLVHLLGLFRVHFFGF